MSKADIATIIKTINELYLPNYRYIKSLDINHPQTSGDFIIHKDSYTSIPQDELSAANFVILYNQIVICSLAYNIIHKQIPEMNDFNMELQDIKKFATSILIRKFESISFNKLILGTDDDLTYTLKLNRVTNKLESNHLVFFDLDLSLANGRHTSHATYCLYEPLYGAPTP